MKWVQSLVMTGICVAAAEQCGAQVDLSGEWAARLHEDQVYRGPGPDMGEYEGFPINEAARLKAESWNPSVYTIPERQCIPFAADHGLTIGNMRVWKEVDAPSQQVIAWKEHHEWQAQERTIWMDGRPHPPAHAAHTWQGFSTGKWEGSVLNVTTTHLKMALVDRNGMPRSDLGVLNDHYVRHDNVLTIIQVVQDPTYLTEPFIRSRDFSWNPNQRMGGYSCRPAVEIAGRPKGFVPHYLPGTNPYLNVATTRHKVPSVAAVGGAATMYPEFRLQLPPPAAKESLRKVEPYRKGGGGGARDRSARTAVANPYLTASGAAESAVKTLPIRAGVFMLQTGDGVNVTVQVGEESVLVVDTGFERSSPALLTAIRQLSSKPIRYVVNTGFTADRTGGNVSISKAGSAIQELAFLGTAIRGDTAATIIAHENVLNRMSAPTGAASPTPSDAWPSETYNVAWDEIYNGEPVQIYSVPKSYADGDSVVFFRRSDVLSTGNVFSTLNYPVIDVQSGGSVNGVIDALNLIIDLAVPGDKQEGGTYIVPGRGRLTDEADVVEYRDMITIIRDRIREMIRLGMTLEEVQRAKPTADYDVRYSTESWPAERFVEVAYNSLTRSRK